MSIDSRDFGLRLRLNRQKVGWSQSVVAETLGVTAKTVQRWENGSHLPPEHRLVELCRLFCIDMVELLTGEANPVIAGYRRRLISFGRICKSLIVREIDRLELRHSELENIARHGEPCLLELDELHGEICRLQSLLSQISALEKNADDPISFDPLIKSTFSKGNKL